MYTDLQDISGKNQNCDKKLQIQTFLSEMWVYIFILKGLNWDINYNYLFIFHSVAETGSHHDKIMTEL